MTWRPLQEPLDHLKGPSNHSGWDTTIFPRLAQEPVSQPYSCRILPRDDQHSLSHSNIVWLPFVGIGTVLVQVTRLPLLWNQLCARLETNVGNDPE